MNTGRISHAHAQVSIPRAQSVGVVHATDVRHAAGVSRWRVVVTLLLALMLAGCIPVTIRPQFDDENKPIAIPVTPTGSISADGTLVPIYPVSTKAPTGMNWGTIGTIIGVVTSTFLAVYGINARGMIGKLKTVGRIACDLADQNAVAETDQDVERNKMIAQQQQNALGVLGLTQAVRGK
jgi:hypothetical protein